MWPPRSAVGVSRERIGARAILLKAHHVHLHDSLQFLDKGKAPIVEVGKAKENALVFDLYLALKLQSYLQALVRFGAMQLSLSVELNRTQCQGMTNFH